MPYTGVVTKNLIKYIQTKYGARPEFLWAKFPNNAIFRNSRNDKWYAALLIVPKSKLGIHGDGDIEILDLKSDPALISTLVDNKKFFPGYHMNKEHWVTILLDGSISDKDIHALLEISYKITDKD